MSDNRGDAKRGGGSIGEDTFGDALRDVFVGFEAGKYDE